MILTFMTKEYFDKNICIVVQGPITYVDELISSYQQYKENVVISTNYVSENDLEKLIKNNFNVVYNRQANPPGRANFNNQVINTFEGTKKAKDLGFSHILKIRADIFIDNLVKFISYIDKDCIYFSAYHNHDGGYLCEHMLFGKTDFMLKLWDIPLSNSNLPPETQLTKKYEEINSGLEIKFLFPILYENNIKAYWKKKKIYLNQYENDKLFIYEKK